MNPNNKDIITPYRSPGGGVSYLPGKQARIEPTAFAVLAKFELKADVEWLLNKLNRSLRSAKNPPVDFSDYEAENYPWLFSLGIVALTYFFGKDFPNQVSLSTCISQFEQYSKDIRKIKTSLKRDSWNLEGALSWHKGNYGWIEPSSWGLLADCSLLRHSIDATIVEQLNKSIKTRVQFLLETETVDKGWNYGNVYVHNVSLPAMPQPSALCLTALSEAYLNDALIAALPKHEFETNFSKLIELNKLEPSRLTKAWTSIAFGSWNKVSEDSHIDNIYPPRQGESIVDFLLHSISVNAKDRGKLPFFNNRDSLQTAERMSNKEIINFG